MGSSARCILCGRGRIRAFLRSGRGVTSSSSVRCYSATSFSFRTAHSRSGVIGMSRCVTPRCASASTTAFHGELPGLPVEVVLAHLHQVRVDLRGLGADLARRHDSCGPRGRGRTAGVGAQPVRRGVGVALINSLVEAAKGWSPRLLWQPRAANRDRSPVLPGAPRSSTRLCRAGSHFLQVIPTRRGEPEPLVSAAWLFRDRHLDPALLQTGP